MSRLMVEEKTDSIAPEQAQRLAGILDLESGRLAESGCLPAAVAPVCFVRNDLRSELPDGHPRDLPESDVYLAVRRFGRDSDFDTALAGPGAWRRARNSRDGVARRAHRSIRQGWVYRFVDQCCRSNGWYWRERIALPGISNLLRGTGVGRLDALDDSLRPPWAGAETGMMYAPGVSPRT
jgi:hypothetical protein